jgi:hypothetical protein
MLRYSAFFVLVITAAALCPSSFAKNKDKVQKPGAVHLDRDGEKWAGKTLRGMTLEEKIGQLFMIWVRAQFMNVDSPEYAQLRDTMNK